MQVREQQIRGRGGAVRQRVTTSVQSESQTVIAPILVEGAPEPLDVGAAHSGTASARAIAATGGARASRGTTSNRSPSSA